MDSQSTERAAPLLDRLRAHFAAHDTFVSFSWDEVRALGMETPEVVFLNDGRQKLGYPQVEVCGQPRLVGDLAACWLGRGASKRSEDAWAYIEIARELRLVLCIA